MTTAKALTTKVHADFNRVNVYERRPDIDLLDPWTVQAMDDRIASGPGMIGLGTERAEPVSLEVHLLDTSPPDDSAEFDHVTDASVVVETGQLICAGPTDEEAPARRLELEPGTWRVRASHSGLAKKNERIRLQFWRGEPTPPRVTKRWQPPPPRKRKTPADRPIKTRHDAVYRAWMGQTDVALAALEEFAAGDAGAAASVAEILAFRGQWCAMVPYAEALIATPKAVYALNVFNDMCRLVRRAARELGDPSVIASAATRVPAGYEARSDDPLVRELADKTMEPADPIGFKAAVELAEGGTRFRGKPEALAAHSYSLAVSYNVEEEILARWNPSRPTSHFDTCLPVARILIRRGDVDRAWSLLIDRLPTWNAIDGAQVAPTILLLDPILAPLMTAERAEQVLRTVRGPAARSSR